MLGAEERIISTLADNGGEMFQTDIVRQTDLSRSRASEILSSLEKRLLVSRIQEGRNYRVRLNTDGKRRITLGRKHLRMGFTRAAEYPFVVPFRRRMRDDLGIQVEFEIYENGLDVARDLSFLRLDLGMMPVLTSFMFCSMGAPFSLIAPAGSGGSCVVSRKETGKGSLAPNLKVATTKLSTMELLLKSSVREHYLPDESRAVYASSPQGIIKGLASRQFDAACIWEPYASILSKKYGMSKTVNYSDIAEHVCCVLSAGNHINDRLLKGISSRFKESVEAFAKNPDSYVPPYSAITGFHPSMIREVSEEYSYPIELDAKLISKQFERAGVLTPIPSTVKGMIRHAE